MKKESTEINSVSLIGKISSEFQFSHKMEGVCYYTAKIDVERASGYTDHIPIMVPRNTHRLPKEDSYVCIEGQFCSKNQIIDGQRRVALNVLALTIKDWSKEDEDIGKNQIFLNGYICRKPIYRKTPLGRYISDVCVAVNSTHNHSDYLPCIFWGKNAKAVSILPVGYHIQIWGRIQSRIYHKKIKQELREETAYEVSVSKMKYDKPFLP